MKTYTTTIKKNRLLIEIDEHTTSPREWSNLGYFITQCRKYESPDKHFDLQYIIKEKVDYASSQDDQVKRIKKEYNKENPSDKIVAIYPIVKHEHGGVSYSIGTVQGFDHSNNGFYIITKSSQKAMGTPKASFEEVIKGELKVYNSYVNSAVYRYTLHDEQGGHEESCGGFYDIEDIKEYLPEEWKDEDLTKYIQ